MKNVTMLSTLLAALATVPALAQDITVKVNGNSVPFADTQPQQVEGRVLVPFRGVLEEIGADINWNEATQTVRAKLDNRNIELKLGSQTAKVNGEPVYLRVPARRIGGSTMVPLRFLGEALGANVEWVEPRQTVLITTDTARDPVVNRNLEREQRHERWEERNRNRSIEVRVEGRIVSLGDDLPYYKNDSPMVPLTRFAQLSQQLYRYDSGKGTISFPDTHLFHEVGTRWIEKNGRKIWLETPSEMKGSEIYVPLELFERGWPGHFSWNARTRAISILP